MRKLFKMIVAFCTAISLMACTSQEQKTVSSDTLVVYSPNSEGLINAVVPLFEQKYNVKVELIQAGTGQLIKRLQSEKDAPYADVLFGGSFATINDNRELFMDYVSVNDGNVIEAYQNKNGFITSYTLDGSVLLVNKNLVGDIKIESYEDLLNPELKGKIASADPSNSSSAFAQLTNMLLAKGGYESDAAWEYVKELYANIDGKLKSGSSAVYKSVADGEMVVALTYEDPSVKLVQDNAPVEVVYPSEGVVYLPAGSAIVKGTQNEELAKKFIDLLLSQEVQDILGSSTTNRPIIKDAKISDTMKPLDEIHVIIEDMPYVQANKSKIVEHFKEIYIELGNTYE